MTNEEIKKISVLQRQGKGYKAIADTLGLPVNSVKSWCRRHPLDDATGHCQQCGAPIHQTPHKRQRKFCDSACRIAWWNAHPEDRIKKPAYDHTCAFCGQPFSSERAGSKYCSTRCFADARRKEDNHG